MKHRTHVFRRRLASRLVAVAGAASVALPFAACGTISGGTAAGSGGAATTSSAASSSHASSSSSAASGSGSGGAGLGGSTGVFTTSSGGLDGSGMFILMQCFEWPPVVDAGPDAGDAGDAGVDPTGPCPIDTLTVVELVTGGTCPTGGWAPYMIESGPVFTAAGEDAGGQCCYDMAMMLCLGTGRPFVVAGEARVAPEARGPGWARGARPALDDLAPGERAALAAAWTADALLEHASVASFSRFSLALLAAGAPADLVELAHRAALDEVRHAELCFALASAYAGEPVAPGGFPAGAVVEVGASLAELAASTVLEGCVGETVAAVLAAEQLARATDPAVRAALAQIAADEARHAELAWKTVAWAVRTGGDDVRAAVERALAGALPGASREGDAGSAVMMAHGRLDPATAADVARATMAEVVAPAAKALLRGTTQARAEARSPSPSV